MANPPILHIFQDDKDDLCRSGEIDNPWNRPLRFQAVCGSLPSGLARSTAFGSCCAKTLPS